MQPESISMEVRFIQLSNRARSRATPRGAAMAGKKTSCSKQWWYSRMTETWSSSREPKCANTPDLLMPITSARAPMDRPSRPMCVAWPSAASMMAALVCCPFCKAREPPLRARDVRETWDAGLEEGVADMGATKTNDRSILQQIHRSAQSGVKNREPPPNWRDASFCFQIIRVQARSRRQCYGTARRSNNDTDGLNMESEHQR